MELQTAIIDIGKTLVQNIALQAKIETFISLQTV